MQKTASVYVHGFPPVNECSSEGRESQAVISDLDGTILRGRSSFPYFMLIAFEASGIFRFALLLLLSPIAWILYHFISEAAGIRFLIFVAFSGVKMSEIVSVSRAVLPKFYLEDLHSETWRVLSSFGKKYILTANPRVMIEPLGLDYLGVDQVIGTELEVSESGRATGFVKAPGVLVGKNKSRAMEKFFESKDNLPKVALGDRESDYPFMELCKEAYIVPVNQNVEAVPKEKLPKPVIFHDGRFVNRPTPLMALLILLWMPIGFLLAIIRIAAGALLPMPAVYYAFWMLGVRVFVKGTLPPPPVRDSKSGILFACTHKTLLDPIFLSTALGRPVTAVVYSVSRLSEFLAPIRTVRLTRDRERDASNIRKLLQEGDLVICPEGTTCREPFLLRFSALFTELAEQIVPVATNNRMSLFHGTTARGWKAMDTFFYFMNPSPVYEVIFLDQIPRELTCGAGKSAFEVANYIQRILAGTLGFECTSFTRKDKYKMLAGNDGTVPVKAHLSPKKATGS